ncbi:MAG: glycine cleavage system aminomethyltransferase GcvT [Acidimicrobiia bacterium]
MNDAVASRFSPLDAQHRALGARMVPFGGWEMPIQYTGVLDEHRACRESAAVFDVSHLGAVAVSGPGAHAALQWVFTNDLDRIAPGRAQYAHLLDDRDAHVVDDVITWWLGPEEFLVIPNASNSEPAMRALLEAAHRHAGGAPCEVVDLIDEHRALLAVQGPEARARLAKVWPAAAEVGRFDVQMLDWGAAHGIVAGTGYTGEDGVEIHVDAATAPALWDALVAVDIVPAGLGARDLLRLEMGYPLHGHELGVDITPLEAGLGWVVRPDKADFRGKDALQTHQAHGVGKLLQGLVFEGRRFARDGAEVFEVGGEEPIGHVTSGNYSPMRERGIALAFLTPDHGPGDAVEVDVRGTRIPAQVERPPFVRR